MESITSNWVEIGALIVAIIVALTGLRTAKTAEKAAEAQLDAVHASAISQAIDDYQRLGRDMETLVDWYRSTVEADKDFLEVYAGDRDGVDHVSGARRNVRLYFQKCAQLLSSGSISSRVFHAMAHKKGLNILHRIVVPLEQLKLQDSMTFFEENPEMKIYLGSGYKKHGDGLFTFERLNR
ncbi:MAG TPA: hypothetical protein VMX97_12700 [Hyphomicrobiaceae bacterium]|nr:hypothetical protein [Hyphomicrobiaceae bacterium]